MDRRLLCAGPFDTDDRLNQEASETQIGRWGATCIPIGPPRGEPQQRRFWENREGLDLAYPVCCHSRPPLVKTILANRAKIGVIALFTPVLLPAECSNKLVSSQMAP